MPLSQRSILIEAPPARVFAYFHNPGAYPVICDSVESVRETAPGHWAWQTEDGPWETKLAEEVPGRRLVFERFAPPARATLAINPVNGNASWVVLTVDIETSHDGGRGEVELSLLGRALGQLLRRARDQIEESQGTEPPALG